MNPRTCFALALCLVTQCARSSTEVAPGDRAHLAAMAHEHQHDTPVANASDIPPRVAVVDQTLTYTVLDGRPVRGYLAEPATSSSAQRLPALLVVHEWWGLNDNVRMMTRRLAGEGYQALAVDLYEGRVASTPDEARAAMQAAMANPERLAQNLRAAAMALRTARGAPRLGVVGWCFGGGWSLESALRSPEFIDAAVMYYGRPVTDRARLERLDAPLLGLFGGADQGIPLADVRAMESQLRELGKDVTVQIYEGAGHAFANPSGQNYQPQTAQDAWVRTVEFLGRHLHGAQ